MFIVSLRKSVGCRIVVVEELNAQKRIGLEWIRGHALVRAFRRDTCCEVVWTKALPAGNTTRSRRRSHTMLVAVYSKRKCMRFEGIIYTKFWARTALFCVCPGISILPVNISECTVGMIWSRSLVCALYRMHTVYLDRRNSSFKWSMRILNGQSCPSMRR